MPATDSIAVGQQDEGLVVERVFDAPRELVWRAWTEPEHFMRWYGPTGFTMPACEIDFRVGGRHLWGLRSPDGWEYWTTGVYREIVRFERFVATDTLADQHGNVVSAAHYGMGGDVPMETLIRSPSRTSAVRRRSRCDRPAGPTTTWQRVRPAAGTRPSTNCRARSRLPERMHYRALAPRGPCRNGSATTSAGWGVPSVSTMTRRRSGGR